MADKKINANEILNDGDLDKVAGGAAEETYEAIGLLNDKFGIDLTTSGDYDAAVKVLTEKYANVGVKFQAVDHAPNVYTDIKTGKAISHKDALQILTNGGGK